MSDEEALSKRERQKARRQERLQEQRVAADRARRSRLTVLIAIALIIAAGIGYLVFDRAAQRQAVAALVDEMGCTPAEAQPDEGQGHFGSLDELSANPPQGLYKDGLGTSGMHMPDVARSGVYDVKVDQRLVVHNLEHGYVAFWYDAGADADQVESLKEWARRQIDRGRQKVVVAEIHEELPGEANFAAVTWGSRQLCEGFAPEIAETFLDRFHGNAAAPEALVAPHVGEGFIDPAEIGGPVLYPPIGDFGIAAGDGGGGEASMDPAATEGTEAPEATETPASE
ncbi:MAG TPA: DUF3105 domain-containing protein [Egibacteraceae bacterium]|nr:DUF3105 domain-containing protein [Egibacteraceae bacterium]